MAFNRPLLRTSYEQDAEIFPTYTQKGVTVAFGIALILMGLGQWPFDWLPEPPPSSCSSVDVASFTAVSCISPVDVDRRACGRLIRCEF